MSCRVAILILACTLTGGLRADDDWLSRPYSVWVGVAPVDEDVEAAIWSSLGPGCRRAEARGEADKLLEVTLDRTDDRTTIEVTEFDNWLRLSGPAITATVESAELVPAAAAQLAKQAFRPRVVVSRVGDSYEATVIAERLDAGIVDDMVWFRPVVRFFDTDGAWRSTSETPWTYFRLGERTGLGRAVHLESALPQPLPGRIRRGLIVGLACPVVHRETAVTIVDATTSQTRPGLRVEVVSTNGRDSDAENGGESEASAGSEADGKVVERVTADRRGRVLLTTSSTSPVRLRVFSTNLVADVPILVGAESTIDLPIASDVERVELQERLSAIEYRLQDLVARRSVLIARIRDDVDQKQWQSAESLLVKLDEIPPVTSLTVALNAARVAAVDSATARGDRSLASWLRRKAARLEKTINSLEDPNLSDDFRDEMKALKEIEAEATAIKSSASDAAKSNEP